ncbi:Leucine Rich repeat-containing domain protein [Aphelenchoides bicaudatus]|nr:Leucine Rich repeat-containing domain protein [Aphelenchoides bicaudatus]
MPPKRKILVGRDAADDFQKRRKFNELLTSLTIRDSSIRLDGRIFTLSHLQELCLENIGLDGERNQRLLKQLCRLPNLKTLSLANNSLVDISIEICDAISSGLQQLVLSDNQLLELPRRLTRFKNLVALDASNNKIEYVHENFCLLRSLQFLKLQQNNLRNVPYSLLYGHRYRELDLSGNSQLFIKHAEVVEGNPSEVPYLKVLTLARLFNINENSDHLLPEHLKSERDQLLHRCFMCCKNIGFHGTDYVKHGQIDVRNCGENVYYKQSEVMINFIAYVCTDCRSKAVRFKIFP